MWYYIDGDKNRVGPVSEATILTLYFDGVLNGDSLVWRRGLKSWEKLSDTTLIKTLNSKMESISTKRFEIYLKLFRGSLISLGIFLFVVMYMGIRKIILIDLILSGRESTPIYLSCTLQESKILSGYTMYVVILLLMVIFKFGFEWIYCVSKNTRVIEKSYRDSPNFVAWSIFIPFINMLVPFFSLKRIYKMALMCDRVGYTSYTKMMMFLWWFFTLFSVFLCALKFLSYSSVTSFVSTRGVIYYDIFTSIIGVVTIVMWIIFVTKLSNRQLKILNHFRKR